MGNLGILELLIIVTIIIVPVIILMIVYRAGQASGENKILRRIEDEQRRKRS